DVLQGEHETRSADRHLKAVDDRERQRQAHRHCGAATLLALYGDGAAQRGDIALDDIHAHTTSGKIGDTVRGGKSGLKDEVEDLGVRQRATFLEQPTLHGLGQYLVPLQSAAIVTDFNDDAAGVVV